MVARGALVCVALFCAALSATAVAGVAVESKDALIHHFAEGGRLEDSTGGRKLLTNSWPRPAWVFQNGVVSAAQINSGSGNSEQLGFVSWQQSNAQAVNNAQNNAGSNSGNVGASNSGRKLLTQSWPRPAWVFQNGQVQAWQGNYASGNSVQVGVLSSQQSNAQAVNNAQNNAGSDSGNVGASNSGK